MLQYNIFGGVDEIDEYIDPQRVKKIKSNSLLINIFSNFDDVNDIEI